MSTSFTEPDWTNFKPTPISTLIELGRVFKGRPISFLAKPPAPEYVRDVLAVLGVPSLVPFLIAQVVYGKRGEISIDTMGGELALSMKMDRSDPSMCSSILSDDDEIWVVFDMNRRDR